MQTVDVVCTLRKDACGVFLRTVPFARIARVLLPKHYTLSVALTGDARARRINRVYRKKTRAPNVLSFPLEKYVGEIILNVRKAEREARSLNIGRKARIAHLYIHAVLHLRGMRHGMAMERRERYELKKFGF